MQIDHTFDIQYLYVLYFSDRKAQYQKLNASCPFFLHEVH